MGIIGLNTIGLDGNVVIKKGEGGGGGSKPKWTGHADAEGLRAIGWTDEDIAYYQENGVNWNEEDDEWHKVTDDNKALYGVLTASSISSYRDRIVYLPKIDTSKETSMSSKFNYCYSLTSIPQLDTSKVTNMNSMFNGCTSLRHIPMLNISNGANVGGLFSNIQSLISIPMLDMSNATNENSICFSCYSLTHIYLKNVKSGLDLSYSPLLTKDSLLYIINNEAATSAITIKLAYYAYNRWATDPDVVAALANHPNISLAK